MAKSAVVDSSPDMVAARNTTQSAGSRWYEPAMEAAAKARSGWQSRVTAELISGAESAWSKVLFPTPRVESWKYTNVEDVAAGPFAIPAQGGVVAPAELSKMVLADVTPHVAVIVDGVFRVELSKLALPAGVEVLGLAELATRGQDDKLAHLGFSHAHQEQPFAALATALVRDGVCILMARGAVIEAPIHVLNVVTAAAEGAVVAPRLLVVAEENSQVTVLQSFVSSGAERYLNLPVCEIHAAAAAIVDNYVIQNESYAAYHVSTCVTRSERASNPSTHILSFGGRLVRNNADVLLHGSGAYATLNGLTVLSGDQHVDNATLIHHVAPTIESREHFKGIYADRSRGVFSGTITVEQDAQKTNAFQSNQTLLLSPDAGIETRPQLKIWADDVKCTHGATVGQLDADALFYLRSRGLDRDTARNFLVHAFASEVLTSVKVPVLREYIAGLLSEKLESLTR
jgi:Fe-S cluster assembly protein SufD